MKKVILIIGIILVIILSVIIYFTGNEENTNKDNIPPEIILENEEEIIVLGSEFNSKAIANDNIDGDISSKIKISNLDTFKLGEQEIIYGVVDSSGNEAKKKQKIIVRERLEELPVLMYHFFYDNEKYFKQDNNWLKISDFEEQLKYLKENDFYFPTWEEVENYIDGKLELPEKSIVLTIDDGDPSFFDLAVPLLQEYKIPGTIFIIGDWYGSNYDPNLKYVNFESHSQNMHESGANGKGKMVNLSYEEILNDLNTSSKSLGDATIFCYPFGHYNDTAIKALEDSPFKMAFTIENGKVKKGSSKFKLPRIRISDGDNLESFINKIK